MDFYGEDDYRRALRGKLREVRKQRPVMTLKHLATRIPIQYTYLSKALNDDKTHLSEDHLFALCDLLELMPEEQDFLIQLRSLAVTQNPTRREKLSARISRLRRSRKLNASVQDFEGGSLNQEISYLLDAVMVIVHVALNIPEYAKNPRRLATGLGLTPQRLQEVLYRLHQLDFIELSEGGGEVVKVNRSNIHFSKDHPLMRSHQFLLKSLSAGQLAKLDEAEKLSFMATFSADADGFIKIRGAFERFLEQAEAIALKCRSEKAFQLNFDLFKWI